MRTIQAIRSELANRRATRRRRLRLERELASFNTPSARLEIETILDRHPADQTQAIRAILNRQASSKIL